MNIPSVDHIINLSDNLQRDSLDHIEEYLNDN